MKKPDRLALTPAQPSIADGAWWTVCIGSAWHFFGAAASHSVCSVTLIALKTCAHSAVVGSTTLCIEATLGLLAHVLALGNVVLFPTKGIQWAVIIHQAINRLLASLSVGITHSARWTQALVVSSEVVTACTRTTWLFGTVINRLTSLEGVSFEATTAEAHSLVTLRHTDSIFSTLVVYTTCS